MRHFDLPRFAAGDLIQADHGLGRVAAVDAFMADACGADIGRLDGDARRRQRRIDHIEGAERADVFAERRLAEERFQSE